MARKAKLLNIPRGYLSWSQVDLWERNKDEYVQVYFMGKKRPPNKHMLFGSEVAEDGEKGTSERETVKALNMLLPTYKYMEHKIDAEVKTKNGLLRLHGRIDTFDSKPLRFRERKTGTVPWTAGRVSKHGQIDFYYMLIYLSGKKLPKEAWLDWAQTRENDDGEIELTGVTREFAATRTMADVLKMIARATKAATEIAELYEQKLMAM